MNEVIKNSVLALIVVASGYNVAVADPVNINITGKVIASPCTVDTASNLSVDLGQNLQAADLNASGKFSTWVPFSLKVSNCPNSTNNVIATFSGTANAADTSRLYQNTGGAGNLAVELQQADLPNKALGNGQMLTVPVAMDNTAEFKLRTRAWATAVALPGTIVAVVSATFTYN